MDGGNVQRELQQFILKQIPDADVEYIDDVVLDYLADILSSLGDGDSSFDVDQFTELVSAYIPEFAVVDGSIIYEWVINLSELYNTHCDTSGPSIGCSQQFQSSPKLSQQRKPNLKKSKSETHTEIKLEKELENLTAMFPSLCMSQIKPVLARHGEDIDACVSELLQIAETKLQGRTTKQVKQSSVQNAAVEKRDYIISKYSYVEETKRCHNPFVPKEEPKKMIRYRDNQVVSTKGERYSIQTKKDNENEDMKKTYINLKPLRKYRFH